MGTDFLLLWSQIAMYTATILAQLAALALTIRKWRKGTTP